MKETAAYYKKARKFYDALARQLVRQGHALDIFACSLDQVRHRVRSRLGIDVRWRNSVELRVVLLVKCPLSSQLW